MSMSVGASSDALAYLQQLLQQGTAGASKSTGAADPLSELIQTLSGSGSDTDPLTAPPSTAAGSGASGVPPFGSGTMAQLLSLQNQSAKGPEQAFFSKLDTDGDGAISKSEFESAASKAGVDTSVADAVFDKIDGGGDSNGSISQGELAKADHGGGHHVHGGGGGGGGGEGGGLDALMSGAGADGATTQTTTNADGSSTTTISYADGSSIDMNTPAAPTPTTASTSGDGSSSNSSDSGSGSSTSSQATSNLLEQLIKMQSQMLSAMQASASTMSIAA
jgi:hypothetical protein